MEWVQIAREGAEGQREEKMGVQHHSKTSEAQSLLETHVSQRRLTWWVYSYPWAVLAEECDLSQKSASV
jgi:hypothetical protein